MSTRVAFVRGLGTGAGLLLLAGAATFALKPELFLSWLLRGAVSRDRSLSNRERAERIAQLSPDYLDHCRAAGM